MTHVIFTHFYLDPAADAFRQAIAKFCAFGDSANRVDEDVYAPKGRPDAVYLCAFACFDEVAFVSLVQAIPWDSPASISAIRRCSGSHRFELIELSMDYQLSRKSRLSTAAGWNVDPSNQQLEFFESAYPRLLERRRELIRDSLRNPHRHFESYHVLESITTEVPWIFDCVLTYPEREMTQSSRQAFGPGKNDWKMVTTKHRMVGADLAYRGVHAGLFCDSADVGVEIFEQANAALLLLQVGEKLRIDGTIDIRASGNLQIEKIRRIERMAGT